MFRMRPHDMLFGNDIVLIDETRKLFNSKLETWTKALESKGVKINRSRTEYT